MFRTLAVIAATTAVMGGLAGPAMAAPVTSDHAVATAHQVQGVIPVAHANTVTLDNLNLSSLSFTPSGDYSITSGQPWEGVTTQMSGSSLAITAQAGRHDSSGPAQWFAQGTTAMVGAGSYSSSPSELNFAFSGTLTTDGTAYPIVIGQGSNAGGNNWWIGGAGWIQNGSGAMVSGDQQTVITVSSDNSFTVTTADPQG